MTFGEFTFWGTALIIVLTALVVVLSPNIIHSALALVVSFLGVAAVYFELGAGYLGLVQILVYAGAISVLIIFAIMLVMDKTPNKSNLAYSHGKLTALLIALPLTVVVGWAIASSCQPVTPAIVTEEDLGIMAQLLMGDYVIAFEAAAVLLLVAVVGAIILAKGAGDKK